MKNHAGILRWSSGGVVNRLGRIAGTLSDVGQICAESRELKGPRVGLCGEEAIVRWDLKDHLNFCVDLEVFCVVMRP